METTILFYYADPHIGHAYTAVIADAAARFHRLVGCNPVTFSTGTDEHGLKIQQASSLAKKEPTLFCDQVSASFREALDRCEISYSDYVRTTEIRHKENVLSFWVSNVTFKSQFIENSHWDFWNS